MVKIPARLKQTLGTGSHYARDSGCLTIVSGVWVEPIFANDQAGPKEKINHLASLLQKIILIDFL